MLRRGVRVVERVVVGHLSHGAGVPSSGPRAGPCARGRCPDARSRACVSWIVAGQPQVAEPLVVAPLDASCFLAVDVHGREDRTLRLVENATEKWVYVQEPVPLRRRRACDRIGAPAAEPGSAATRRGAGAQEIARRTRHGRRRRTAGWFPSAVLLDVRSARPARRPSPSAPGGAA